MARRRAGLPVALLVAAALLAAGCGGADVAYDEVKAAPPTLPIPEDTGSSAASGAGDDAAADETPTPTPEAGDDAATGGASTGTGTGSTATGGATTGGTTTDGTTGTDTTGGATTPAQPDQQEEPANTGGATADQGLDQFCADNPGACDGDQP